jgi:hypothetical protein
MQLSARVSLAALVLAALPAPALAGMPSISLTDVARMRVQSISFFLAVLLLSSWLVRLLWNRLQTDFPSLPRLTYGKALGVVTLWGLLFVLVLTMISGARELMTPGAWEKQGLTYRLASDQPPLPAESELDRERIKQMEYLRAALWEYAQDHGGRFPSGAAVAEVPAERWVVPGLSRTRYHYVGGLSPDQGRAPLVYEPGAFGPRRLVLMTDGEIRWMNLDEILKSLPDEVH